MSLFNSEPNPSSCPTAVSALCGGTQAGPWLPSNPHDRNPLREELRWAAKKCGASLVAQLNVSAFSILEHPKTMNSPTRSLYDTYLFENLSFQPKTLVAGPLVATRSKG